MAHKHSVYDTDTHFIINADTREITNASAQKIKLMQGDHNSERFTFECPRVIDGHDMSQVDKIEVHYINIDAKIKDTSKDVYIVSDKQISPDADDVVIFSWLVSGNATKYAGSLIFRITFKCLTGSTIDYAWNTAIFTGVSVGDGMDNGEAVLTEYTDVLEAWKADANSDTYSKAQIDAMLGSYINDVDTLIGGGE